MMLTGVDLGNVNTGVPGSHRLFDSSRPLEPMIGSLRR